MGCGKVWTRSMPEHSGHGCLRPQAIHQTPKIAGGVLALDRPTRGKSSLPARLFPHIPSHATCHTGILHQVANHSSEYSVRTRLHRHMQMLEDIGSLEDLGHRDLSCG